ncbi:hypothetical protein YC2023_015285 [Brassica napus]
MRHDSTAARFSDVSLNVLSSRSHGDRRFRSFDREREQNQTTKQRHSSLLSFAYTCHQEPLYEDSAESPINLSMKILMSWDAIIPNRCNSDIYNFDIFNCDHFNLFRSIGYRDKN